TAEDIAARPLVELGPLTGSTPAEYAARKAIAASRGGTAPRAAPMTPGRPVNEAAASLTPQTLRASFAGNAESDCVGKLPPKTPFDQALAIGDGAAPILQVNNGCLSVWSQAGVRLIGPKTLQAFAGLPASEAVFSPRAIYDWYNHRFILAFGDSDLKNNSYYDIAVSVSDDPTGSWHVYRFLTPTRGNAFNDFIRLGQDRQGVYVASNLFNLTGGVLGAYLMEEWLFLPKSRLYAGTLGSSYWHQSGMQVNNQYTDSTQPANVWSPYDNPRAEFLVGSFNINYGGGNCVNGCSGLYIWSVSNPFGWIEGGPDPEVFVSCCAGTSTYYLPPNASQSGAPNSIETLDTRITGQVSYKSGLLYAALTTADSTSTPPWSDVLVYRLFPGLGNENTSCTGQYQYLCPLITNLSTFDESRIDYGGNFAFYPVPQPDLDGNVFTVYNFSGSGPSCDFSCYPSLAYVSKRATSTLGGFADYGWLIAAGQAPYKSFPWGRYSAAAPTGVGYTDGGAVATSGAGLAGAFVKAGGLWGTQIDAVAYTAPNQP
ncbi:MAG TPA: hypothetical protein VME69_16430, partial [Methylocella sp.]|nr:hypothetical protein [Methylocella sp.]